MIRWSKFFLLLLSFLSFAQISLQQEQQYSDYLFRSGQHELYLQELSLLEKQYPDLKDSILSTRVLFFYQRKQFGNIINEYSERVSYSDISKRRIMISALYRMDSLAFKIQTTDTLLVGLRSLIFLDQHKFRREYRTYYNQKIPYRSPMAAAVFSALIPGAGRFYVGNAKTGLLSLLSIPVFTWQAIHAFRMKGEASTYGWICASARVSLYLSNIYGSQRDAKRYNRKQKTKAIYAVLDSHY